jgi:hypothetical protein
MVELLMHAEGRTKSDTLRCVLVECFLNALHTATSPANLANAFGTTGFVPLNPGRALASPFVHPGHDEVFQSIHPRPGEINARLLTSVDTIRELFNEQMGREMTAADETNLDIKGLWTSIQGNFLLNGIALSPMPPIFSSNEPRTEIRRI